MVLHHSRASSVEIVPDSGRVASHSGGLLVQGLCDKLGLTDAITRIFGRRGIGTIPRGAVMRDLATAIADGGDAVIAVEALRSQAAAFGPVASDTTVWRALGELGEELRHEFRRMLGAARERVWADPRFAQSLCRLLVVDVDATLVTAHMAADRPARRRRLGRGDRPRRHRARVRARCRTCRARRVGRRRAADRAPRAGTCGRADAAARP